MHYDSLIERARNRSILPGVYFEHHHIIPKCLDGTDDIENLVKLFPEEHYIAHLLLVKIYPDEKKLIYAARMMCIGSSNNRRSNKEYAWLKEKFIQLKKGVPRTDEVKEKIKIGNLNKIVSESTKEKIRIARNKQIITEESNKKRSKTAKSKGIRPPDWTGKNHTDESKKKISNSKKGKPSHWKGKKREILICPHCNKSGAGGGMFRYHFDNCKTITHID